ncbi:hypothetical protein EJB05_47514, partial [Eragrostis curvula]
MAAASWWTLGNMIPNTSTNSAQQDKRRRKRTCRPFVPVACSISAVPSGPYLLPRLQPPSSSPTRPDSPRRPLPCPIPPSSSPVVLSRAHVPARRPARTTTLSRVLEFSHRFAAATPSSGCPSRRCASEAFAPCFPVASSADSPHPQPLSVVAVTGRRKKTCSARIWLLASLDTGEEATRKRAWQSHLGTSSCPHHILHTLISLLAAMSECSGTSSLNQRRKRRQPNPICSEAPTSDDVSSSAHSNYLDDSPTNFDSESTRSVRRRLCAQPAGLDNQRDEVGTQRHTKRKAKYSTHRLDMLTCSTSGGGPLTCDTLLDGAPDTADDFPMGFAFQSSRPVRRRLATHPSVLQLAIGGVYAIVFDDDYSQCYTLDVEYSQIYYCTLNDEYSDMLYPR